MVLVTIALIAGVLPMLPTIILAIKRYRSQGRVTKKLVLSLGSVNLLIALMVIGLGIVWFFAPGIVMAAGLLQEPTGDPYTSLAAAIAVGLGSVSAGYAVSTTGSAAVGAIAEKPEVFGRALIFVGLSEGVAIYGLIIAFIILNR